MDLPSEKLAALRIFWERKRRDNAMPSRADLSVAELKPWLGNLALIDLVDGDGGRFRLCGIGLFERFGADVTGDDVRALPDDIRATICPCLARIRETRAATSDTCVRAVSHKHLTFEDLALPLADDGISVTTVLFASYRVHEEATW